MEGLFHTILNSTVLLLRFNGFSGTTSESLSGPSNRRPLCLLSLSLGYKTREELILLCYSLSSELGRNLVYAEKGLQELFSECSRGISGNRRRKKAETALEQREYFVLFSLKWHIKSLSVNIFD